MPDFGTDTNDAALVEVPHRIFPNVRNIARNFFLTQLGFARFDLEFLNVNGCKDIIAD